MSKRRKVVVPDFGSKKPSAPRGAFGKAASAPASIPKPPATKPKATSAKSGHRGK